MKLSSIKRLSLSCAFAVCLHGGSARAASPWAPLTTQPPGAVETMLLLSDGTVMAQNDSGNAWYRLTPDSNGSYVNGAWTTRTSMTSTRKFYCSTVLRDGKVLVAGAEYGTGWGTAEVYDNTLDYPGGTPWTNAPIAAGLIQTMNTIPSKGQNQAGIGAGMGIMLPDGRVLVSPVYPVVPNQTIIYSPTTNTWVAGPTTLGGQDEVCWLKLTDDSILVIDNSGTTSERYIPATNTWIADANMPAGNLYDPFGSEEIGAGILLPDGRGFFIGASGKTAIYTPTNGTANGSWVQGPDIPNDPSGNAQGAVDAPAAMMIDGKVLCAVSRSPYMDSGGTVQTFNSPTRFYEYSYDPLGGIGSFSAELATPSGGQESIKCFQATMLALPDGKVLYSNQSRQLYVYTPSGPPLPEGKPIVAGITVNGDGSYHLIGRKLNGISAGAAYGDDKQMDSNYPLVRLTETNGHVHYARTRDWSSTGVRTGVTPVTTEFALPESVLDGGPVTYSLQVVANGIASDAIVFPGPVWVDFASPINNGLGTFSLPFNTLALGTQIVGSGGNIIIKAGNTTETVTNLSKPMSITAYGGPVTIGSQ